MSSSEDEEEVGSRSRWPAVPLREEALQGQWMHQVMLLLCQTTHRKNQMLAMTPTGGGNNGSCCSTSEFLSHVSQPSEPGSDHTHNVRRPATGKWAFSPSATHRLRLTSSWTAGLAQCLPGQETSLGSSGDCRTRRLSGDC